MSIPFSPSPFTSNKQSIVLGQDLGDHVLANRTFSHSQHSPLLLAKAAPPTALSSHWYLPLLIHCRSPILLVVWVGVDPKGGDSSPSFSAAIREGGCRAGCSNDIMGSSRLLVSFLAVRDTHHCSTLRFSTWVYVLFVSSLVTVPTIALERLSFSLTCNESRGKAWL